MMYLAIKWPFAWPQAKPLQVVNVVEALPPSGPDMHSDFVELRRMVGELTTVTAAQNERLNGVTIDNERQRELIKALQTNESALRGDLREAYSRITALEGMLSEERSARTTQAELYGDVKRQLADADSRLQKQRVDLTAQGEKIAVLENENVVKIGVIQVWQTRAEMAEAEVAKLRMQFDKRTESERGE